MYFIEWNVPVKMIRVRPLQFGTDGSQVSRLWPPSLFGSHGNAGHSACCVNRITWSSSVIYWWSFTIDYFCVDCLLVCCLLLITCLFVVYCWLSVSCLLLIICCLLLITYFSVCCLLFVCLFSSVSGSVAVCLCLRGGAGWHVRNFCF